jgi:23S rRNA pseudouridine2605 synthase
MPGEVDELGSGVTFTAVFVPRRLDKYLRDSTALSVVEVRCACAAGRVTVCVPGPGGSLRAAADWLVFEGDIVALDGDVVRSRTQHHYLVMNKPRYVTVTASDPDGRADLSAWLRQMPKGVFPVGRLDRETSGALLCTDDGDFANAILQPDHHTNKLYWLWLNEHLADDDPRLLAFVGGVQLNKDSELLRAVCALVFNRTSDYTELHVTLDEGKNRHIRKMCNLLGLHLLHLHRKAIGSLCIDGLATGQWRALSATEVEGLWSSCGGAARVTRNKIRALTQMAAAARDSGKPNTRLEQWLDHCPRVEVPLGAAVDSTCRRGTSLAI